MKRKDFLSNEPVYFKLYPEQKYEVYKYTPPKDEQDCGIISRNGNHFCNVEMLTVQGLRYYLFVFKRKISGSLKFDGLVQLEASDYTKLSF